MYRKFEELLEKSGKTAYQVSKDTGIATSTLTAWKNGEYKPKVEKLMLIASYFNVPVDHFLETPTDQASGSSNTGGDEK